MNATLHKQPSSQEHFDQHARSTPATLNTSMHSRSSSAKGVISAFTIANFFKLMVATVLLLLVAQFKWNILVQNRSIPSGISIMKPTTSHSRNRAGADKVDLGAHDVVTNETQESSQRKTATTTSTPTPLEICPPVPPNLGESGKIRMFFTGR